MTNKGLTSGAAVLVMASFTVGWFVHGERECSPDTPATAAELPAADPADAVRAFDRALNRGQGTVVCSEISYALSTQLTRNTGQTCEEIVLAKASIGLSPREFRAAGLSLSYETTGRCDDGTATVTATLRGAKAGEFDFETRVLAVGDSWQIIDSGNLLATD